jgi:molecular chaperone IbpA
MNTKFPTALDLLMDTMRPVVANNKYPPHNIYSTDDRSEFVVEVAVAGFKEHELKVSLKNNNLIIAGSKDYDNPVKPKEYIYRGISEKSFEHSVVLTNDMEIKGCNLVDGILSVYIVKKEKEDSTIIPINKPLQTL